MKLKKKSTKQEIVEYLKDKHLDPEKFNPWLSTRTTTSLNKNVFVLGLGKKINSIEGMSVYFNPFDGTLSFRNEKTHEVEQKPFYMFVSGNRLKLAYNLDNQASIYQLMEEQFDNENIKNILKDAGLFDIDLYDCVRDLYGKENAAQMNFSYLFNETLYADRTDQAIENAILQNYTWKWNRYNDTKDLKEEHNESLNVALFQKFFMKGEFSGEHKNPFACLDDIAALTGVTMKVYYEAHTYQGPDYKMQGVAGFPTYIDPKILLVDESNGMELYSGASIISAVDIFLKNFNNQYHSHSIENSKEKDKSENGGYNIAIQKLLTYDYVNQQMDVLRDYVLSFRDNSIYDDLDSMDYHSKDISKTFDMTKKNIKSIQDAIFDQFSDDKEKNGVTEFDLVCKIYDEFDEYIDKNGYITKEELNQVIADAQKNHDKIFGKQQTGYEEHSHEVSDDKDVDV